MLSRWRSVSTTSIARRTSSSLRGSSVVTAGGPAPARAGTAGSLIPGRSRCPDRQLGRGALLDKMRQPLLAVLDRVADLDRVLRRQLAHVGDDADGALLIGDNRVDQFLDGGGRNRRAIASLQGGFLHLAAD